MTHSLQIVTVTHGLQKRLVSRELISSVKQLTSFAALSALLYTFFRKKSYSTLFKSQCNFQNF